MGPAPVAIFIRSHVEVLTYTSHSVLYVYKTDPKVMVKGETVWINGIPYEAPRDPEQPSEQLCREHEIYQALGSHERILRCFGLVQHEDGSIIALKLESAKQNLRQFIEGHSEVPSMRRRLQIAAAFAQSVSYLHSHGVIWGDLSTRNALVFGEDSSSLKTCDFGGSVLGSVHPEFGEYTYEVRYCPAMPHKEVEKLPMMQRELSALGSAIYEITEWRRPYADVNDRLEIDGIIEGGTMPLIAEENAARDIISRCWSWEHSSASIIADELSALCREQEER